ncbi:MAG: hypothetical protein CL912_30155 [Deltaproteobacteria bacterium]|nr:hypothetical protein [Deltaproteobacteria bacterium]
MTGFLAKSEKMEDTRRNKTLMAPRIMLNREYCSNEAYTAAAKLGGLPVSLNHPTTRSTERRLG